jgi:hypothetical protein
MCGSCCVRSRGPGASGRRWWSMGGLGAQCTYIDLDLDMMAFISSSGRLSAMGAMRAGV